MTKQDTTTYMYQWNASGKTYESPNKETLQAFLDRHNFTKIEEIIELMKDHSNVSYFIGTQTEYDTLRDGLHYFYYKKTDGKLGFAYWRWINILVDGRKPSEPTFKEMVTEVGAIELTKDEYDAIISLNQKIADLKSISSPKLAAYIIKGGEYITLHLDKVSSGALASFIGNNGKVDLNALKAVISGHQNKIDSMVLLVQLFAKYLEAIETGTEASLKELPFDTPTELNTKVDELWKIEESQERQELATKLHLDPKVFDIADKYTITVAGDEPEQLK